MDSGGPFAGALSLPLRLDLVLAKSFQYASSPGPAELEVDRAGGADVDVEPA